MSELLKEYRQYLKDSSTPEEYKKRIQEEIKSDTSDYIDAVTLICDQVEMDIPTAVIELEHLINDATNNDRITVEKNEHFEALVKNTSREKLIPKLFLNEHTEYINSIHERIKEYEDTFPQKKFLNCLDDIKNQLTNAK